mmetsp:Transcript_12314/g.40259  ORF Transcript_12314/g.40259 Transcript_12314/m.40259 type:complete len:309 (-) Transcript_12314:63-989(-)
MGQGLGDVAALQLLRLPDRRVRRHDEARILVFELPFDLLFAEKSVDGAMHRRRDLRQDLVPDVLLAVAVPQEQNHDGRHAPSHRRDVIEVHRPRRIDLALLQDRRIHQRPRIRIRTQGRPLHVVLQEDVLVLFAFRLLHQLLAEQVVPRRILVVPHESVPEVVRFGLVRRRRRDGGLAVVARGVRFVLGVRRGRAFPDTKGDGVSHDDLDVDGAFVDIRENVGVVLGRELPGHRGQPDFVDGEHPVARVDVGREGRGHGLETFLDVGVAFDEEGQEVDDPRLQSAVAAPADVEYLLLLQGGWPFILLW